MPDPDKPARSPLRERLYIIIFEADTPAGKWFDIALLVAIVLSVLVVMLDSVESIHAKHDWMLYCIEWGFTLLFSVEYLVRIWCARRPLRYAFSFYGIVDLLAVLPTYLMEVLPGAHQLSVVRALRLLRTFRIFKLAHMLSEAEVLRRAIWSSRSKIVVFLAFVIIVVVIVGAAMHLIEGPHNTGFKSIPQSMYWTIVTMTTVGYGDVAPATPLGKTLAAVIMVLGYSMIIIPTGIVTAELNQGQRKQLSTKLCPQCAAETHDYDAMHCKFCGAKL